MEQLKLPENLEGLTRGQLLTHLYWEEQQLRYYAGDTIDLRNHLDDVLKRLENIQRIQDALKAVNMLRGEIPEESAVYVNDCPCGRCEL